MNDFLTINYSCKYLNNLTNHKLHHRVNLYWKYQSKITFWKDINNNDICIDNNWRQLYFQFKKLSQQTQISKLTDTYLLCDWATQFDLTSIVYFVMYKETIPDKTCIQSWWQPEWVHDIEFRLIEIRALICYLRTLFNCLVHDSIDTFRYVLSYFKDDYINKTPYHGVFTYNQNCCYPHSIFSQPKTFEQLVQAFEIMEKNLYIDEKIVISKFDFVKSIFLNINSNGYLPLVALCLCFNGTKILRHLLSNNVADNKEFVNNWTMSAECGETISVPGHNFSGATLLGIACTCNTPNVEIIELLIENGANPDILGDKNVSIDETDRYWQCMTLLNVSVTLQSFEMVESALKSKCKITKEMINRVDQFLDMTPLMIAVSNDLEEIAQILLQSGADVNVENTNVCLHMFYISYFH